MKVEETVVTPLYIEIPGGFVQIKLRKRSTTYDMINTFKNAETISLYAIIL